jgi:MOSC domain-containing protein YiiM
MDSLVEVQALAGAGLVGDRYFRGVGTYSGADVVGRQVTLIEGEALAAASVETGKDIRPRDSRRNIVTQGIRLNDLVGREFAVGEVRMRGVELCEPCSHLAQLAGKPMLRTLVHRGGIRADILSDGMIRVGDPIA